MSENPRLKKWLEMMEEGKKSNVANIREYNKEPVVTQQYIVYHSLQKPFVGFWRRLFAALLDSLLLTIGIVILFSLFPESTPGSNALLMI